MIARSDSFGNTLQMPSWSIEGGLLYSDSFNSSRTEFYCLFDLNGLSTSYLSFIGLWLSSPNTVLRMCIELLLLKCFGD